MARLAVAVQASVAPAHSQNLQVRLCSALACLCIHQLLPVKSLDCRADHADKYRLRTWHHCGSGTLGTCTMLDFCLSSLSSSSILSNTIHSICACSLFQHCLPTHPTHACTETRMLPAVPAAALPFPSILEHQPAGVANLLPIGAGNVNVKSGAIIMIMHPRVSCLCRCGC